MTDHLRTLSEICRTCVACVPNAGLPDEDGYYRGPDVCRRASRRFLEAGWLNLVGGCCGTTAAHIVARSPSWSTARRRGRSRTTGARSSPASRRWS